METDIAQCASKMLYMSSLYNVEKLLKIFKYQISCTHILVDCTEDGRKGVLDAFCCVVVREAFSVHAQYGITRNLTYSLRHASRKTHATSLLGVSARPVFLVAWVQSDDFARNKCSTYLQAWMVVSHAQHEPAYP